MAAVQQRPLAREACCDMMESVLRKCASAADLAASDRPTPGTGRSVLNSTTGEASPSKPETASPVEPVRRAAKRGRGGADCGEPGGRRKQARQAKPTLQRVLEEWAARLDSDQVTGQSTVEVALQLFRAFLLAPLGEQGTESRTESLMGGFSASRRAQLAGCLWLACKLGETQTVTPGCAQLAHACSVRTNVLRQAEVDVCNALEWNLLLCTGAISPATDRPTEVCC